MLLDINDGGLQNAIDRSITIQHDSAFAEYRDMRLTTAFQPIVSLSHQKIIAYEALLRGVDIYGRPISPVDVLIESAKHNEYVQMDQLLSAMHLQNAQLQNISDCWVSINISPQTIIENQYQSVFFADLLQGLGVSPNRIIVEIVETPILGEEQLAEACAVFKELGCLVAIDDFGAGHSNFERIWKIKPDMVKFDRATIVQAERDITVRRSLSGLVSLFHEAGCFVAMEGIDTQEQVYISMDADVDFVQGYYFAKPNHTAISYPEMNVSLGNLLRDFRSNNTDYLSEVDDTLNNYISEFMVCAYSIENLNSLQRVCELFLEQPLVQRCFLIDSEGVQVGENVEAQTEDVDLNEKFSPLASGEGANWYRRQYYRRAIRNPMQVQVSRPYLSMRDARYCITLSIALRIEKAMYVLCADVKWEKFSLWSQ